MQSQSQNLEASSSMADKSTRGGSLSKHDVAALILQRYNATTVLDLLGEVYRFQDVQDVKIDWNALVKQTKTGITNPREYQMLWRHLAYCDPLLEELEDESEPLDDDGDLAYELEAFPTVSNEASTEVAACVKELGSGQNVHGGKAFDEYVPSAPPFYMLTYEHVPSAPPFLGSDGENDQEELPQSSKSNHTSLRADSRDFAAKLSIDLKEGHKQEESSKPSNRNVCAENGASSGSLPVRLPTFHASSLGPWHSYIAYDACARLCRHALAKGCIEASIFLENDCALLRNTFGLSQVLLQSEEELLVNRASEVGSKEAGPKPKKMKVQVRMALDPPTGCNCSSIKPPKVKLESIQRLFYSLQSKCSSGWQAVRRIPFTPRVHVDGSFSRNSLADMQASTQYDDDDTLKCDSVAKMVAYDIVMEVSMKVQKFQQRKLLLNDPWKWLLTEFASYYGVSDTYTNLRYLSYIMDVATPTADCLSLVYDLLLPVISIMKGHRKSTLSHQENRILGEVDEQIKQILALVFENYKSLDEQSTYGIMDVFRPATGIAAPVLEPAVKLYELLHDILSPEAHDILSPGAHDILSPEVQNKLYSYFQAAAKKRLRRHLTETDEYVSFNGKGYSMDVIAVSTAYQKMKSLCLNIRNEIFTDIEIHNCNILPSFIDLPNLSSAIYSAELSSRLRAFLVACPPLGPSPVVTELVIATADFQKDLASWNINPTKNGVDAKELFHPYIIIWIEEKRLSLLEKCKVDKVKWSGIHKKHWTNRQRLNTSKIHNDTTKESFVDEMYDLLKETLNDYEVIINRWPEYTFALENAIADIENAVIESLDKQYADVVAPLKEKNMKLKKFGLKYVQKLTKRTTNPYVVPSKLGILLNSLKRMLDVLHPMIERQFKSWGSCCISGERLSEITVMLRSKFRSYIQAIVEKLLENTRLQNGTKLKKILQDSKKCVGESEIRSRMQPLMEQLMNTMNDLHTIFETHVFIAICRGYWDRMGQDVLSFLENKKENRSWYKRFLENKKENRSWYKGLRVAVSILDGTFMSQLQQLLQNALQEKDVEPPSSIVEVRSMLCPDDAASYKMPIC